MRRSWATLVAAALIAATAIAVSIVSASAARSKVTRMVVVERATTDEVIDLKAEGDSNGDLLVFHNDLYDEDNQEVVGFDQGDCVRIVAGVSWECRWMNRFANGTITVEGPFYDARPSVLAITGGTGAYRDARGSMRLVPRDEAGTEYTFVFRIVKE